MRQYHALMATEGLTVEFTEDGLAEIAATAVQVNERTENIGARRPFTIMERLLEQVSLKGRNCRRRRWSWMPRMYRNGLLNIVKDQDPEPLYFVGAARERGVTHEQTD